MIKKIVKLHTEAMGRETAAHLFKHRAAMLREAQRGAPVSYLVKELESQASLWEDCAAYLETK